MKKINSTPYKWIANITLEQFRRLNKKWNLKEKRIYFLAIPKSEKSKSSAELEKLGYVGLYRYVSDV